MDERQLKDKDMVFQRYRGIGLTERLQNATWDKVRPDFKSQLLSCTSEWICDKSLIKGKGLGLAGNTGIGKSCAIACRMKGWALIGGERLPDGSIAGYMDIRWIYWPDYSQALQDAQRDFDSNKRIYLTNTLKLTNILVLDDLGRERCGADSFAVSILDSVAQDRYEASLPIFWTSNLDGNALIKFYGLPLVDRLNAIAPMSEWRDGVSLR
jgi:DNA replication protein DnaC